MQINSLVNDWQTSAADLLWERYDLLKFAMPNYEEVHIRLRDEARTHAKYHPYSTNLISVDIGCGFGATSLQVLEADHRISVTCIDSSDAVIAVARVNLSSYGTRADFIPSDVLSALRSLPANSAHIVVSGYTFHNFDSVYRKETLRECYRILKPSGVFINVDIVGLDTKDQNYTEFANRLKKLNLFRIIGRNDLYEAWSQHYVADEKSKLGAVSQLEILQEVGFKEVKYAWQKGFDSLCVATKKDKQVFMAMPFGSKSFAELTQERHILHEMAQRYGVTLVEQFVGVESEKEYSGRSYDPVWVIEKDRYFIQQADVVIADFRGASIGRDMEVVLAKEVYKKVVITIADDENIRTSFWLRRFSDHIVSSIDEAFVIAKKTA